MTVDEKDWAVIARTGPGDEPWRVAFGVRAHIVDPDINKQLHEKYGRLLPGSRPLEYDLVNANPYWAHQRCAKTFHSERIVLCGDAAHCNNPIGELGLTNGFLDSAALGNCLLRFLVLEEEAGPLLSRYGEVRKATWQEFTNKASTEVKLRLHSGNPKIVAEREAFIYALNNDPDVHKKAASSMNKANPGHV